MSVKPVDVTSTDDARKKVSDIEVVGNPDVWQLICKTSSKSQSWMRSTKAMDIPGLGVVLQCSTQSLGYNPAEAMCFIPGARIVMTKSGEKLIMKA